MSGELGDTNGNGLLDTDEVWTYTCITNLTQTTTNTATVSAFADGLKATDSFTLTVKVSIPVASSTPSFPDTGGSGPSLTNVVWGFLGGVLAVLIALFFLKKKRAPSMVPDGMPEFFGKK